MIAVFTLRLIYSIFLYCLLPLVLLRQFILGFRTPAYWSRWPERFGYVPFHSQSQPLFWLHAVSVGEVEAATPVIDRLLIEPSRFKIVITTVTPTGSEAVKRRFGDTITHHYLPYDLPGAVQRFLERLKPSVCVIMETELWPNLYHYCHLVNAPVVLINARMSLKSLAGYKKFPFLLKETFSNVARVLAQTETDANRFVLAGCEREKVSVSGNLKFDVNLPEGAGAQAQLLRNELFSDRPVWIADSTHEKEEKLLLDVHETILEQNENSCFILATGRRRRSDGVSGLCLQRGLNVVRKSVGDKCTESTQIFILDTLGELQSYYACADIALVGGSLVTAGGHNMLEPASLGVPVITGVHLENFQEISNLLIEAKAMIVVKNEFEFLEKTMQLFGDSDLRKHMGGNGKKVVTSNRGNIEEVLKTLKLILE